jgi:hypothetical protein
MRHTALFIGNQDRSCTAKHGTAQTDSHTQYRKRSTECNKLHLAANVSSNLPLEAVVIVLVLLPNGNDVVDVVPQVLFILDVLLECVPANGAVEHLVGDPAHEAHLLGVFQARHELLSDFHKLVECDTYETANIE